MTNVNFHRNIFSRQVETKNSFQCVEWDVYSKGSAGIKHSIGILEVSSGIGVLASYKLKFSNWCFVVDLDILIKKNFLQHIQTIEVKLYVFTCMSPY